MRPIATSRVCSSRRCADEACPGARSVAVRSQGPRCYVTRLDLKQRPLVSIIIPTSDKRTLLETTLESIWARHRLRALRDHHRRQREHGCRRRELSRVTCAASGSALEPAVQLLGDQQLRRPARARRAVAVPEQRRRGDSAGLAHGDARARAATRGRRGWREAAVWRRTDPACRGRGRHQPCRRQRLPIVAGRSRSGTCGSPTSHATAVRSPAPA